ncbi:TPA: peptidase S8, partial [Salmonella enterica subsp. enterica serovar Java]
NQITAVPSPISRPESDCWDVVMEFFNPKERLTVARKLYRYTIDVSDVVPVTIGDVRSWNAY